MKFRRFIGCVLLVMVAFNTAACTKGRESTMMAPVRPQDREMDCEELKLEINDAVFVKKEAQENRGLRLGNILWPFGYLATFLSARQAIQLADKRIAYLQSIFRVKDCSAGRYRYE